MNTRKCHGNRGVFAVLFLTLLMVLAACTKKSVEKNTSESKVSVPYALAQVGVLNDNPLSDIRVRQAIAYAIDVEAITQTLFEGKAIPADSLISDPLWKAEGLDAYPYAPEKAKALLAAAGWDAARVLDVVYYYSDELTVDLMTVIQSYLADVGMKMTFRKLSGDLGAQLWTSPVDARNGPSAVNWDMAYGAIGALVWSSFYNRFLPGTALNSHTPTDEQYAELIYATQLTVDTQAQMSAYRVLSQYENKALYVLPLYYQQIFIVQNTRLDRKGSPYGNEQFAYDWRIIDWDIEADDSGKHLLNMNRGPIEFFDGTFGNPSAMNTNKILFDRLITSDASLSPTKGQLAQRYQLSSDGLTLEMVLRDGVTWHDGRRFTAEDVAFTVEYSLRVPLANPVAQTTYLALEGAQAYLDGLADSISGIVISGNTITFRFAKLDPNALFTFAQWPPLPKHLLADNDPLQSHQDSFWQHPIGTGPFAVQEVKMGDYATFVRYANYWDKTGTGNIEEILLLPSQDGDPNFVINVQAGKIDYGYTKNVADATGVEGTPNIEIEPVSIRYTRLLYFNKYPRK